jgi:two-component system chemotaxis response regulator CheY
MPRRVLDIGNCDPDHAAICRLIEGNFDAQVDRAHQWDDALALLQTREYALVLVNRKLDVDYSDGLEIIKKLKADTKLSSVPVMLITNYPEHQQAAVAAGALAGFGKLELDKPQTREKLAPHLTGA